MGDEWLGIIPELTDNQLTLLVYSQPTSKGIDPKALLKFNLLWSFPSFCLSFHTHTLSHAVCAVFSVCQQ